MIVIHCGSLIVQRRTPNLILHCGATHADLKDVRKVPTPRPSETWCPIPHHELISTVQQTLKTTRLRIGTHQQRPLDLRCADEEVPCAPVNTGLFDVWGNVWEWCESPPNVISAKMPLRGGSWVEGGYKPQLRKHYRRFE